MGDGMRYCYDCEKYTKMPSKEEFERQVAEAGRRLEEAKDELFEGKENLGRRQK